MAKAKKIFGVSVFLVLVMAFSLITPVFGSDETEELLFEEAVGGGIEADTESMESDTQEENETLFEEDFEQNDIEKEPEDEKEENGSKSLKTTSPPGQPTFDSSTANSITLKAMAAPSGWYTQYRKRPANGSWANDWQTGTIFTGLVNGAVYQFQARFAASNTSTHAHSAESLPSINMTTSPNQITLANTTATSITVNSTTAGTNWTTEYSIRSGSTGNWSAWQTGTVFSNLTNTMTYQVQARYRANNIGHATTSASIPSMTMTPSPAQRIVSGVPTANSITVNATTITNWTTEYRIRMATGAWINNWQTSNTFTGLSSGTAYQVQARFRGNNTTHATTSESADSANIVTLYTTSAPSKRVVSGTPTMTSITVNATTAPSGWTTQYRIKTATGTWGNNWQNSNTFTTLTAGTVYQVQARCTANNINTHAHSAESVASDNISTAKIYNYTARILRDNVVAQTTAQNAYNSAIGAFVSNFNISFYSLSNNVANTDLNLSSSCTPGSGTICSTLCGTLSNCNSTSGHHKSSGRLLNLHRTSTEFTIRVVSYKLCWYGWSPLKHGEVSGLGDTWGGRNSVVTNHSSPGSYSLQYLIRHELSHNLGVDDDVCTVNEACVIKDENGYNSWCTKHRNQIKNRHPLF